MIEKRCGNCRNKKEEVEIIAPHTSGTVFNCRQDKQITWEELRRGCDKFNPNRRTKVKDFMTKLKEETK